MERPARNIVFWLEQVLYSADRLDRHLDGCAPEQFAADEILIDAASWCVACIGEACGKILEIDPHFDERNPALPVRQAYAARNRYVHGYFNLDVGPIWNTATQAVPQLATAIRLFLERP